jgi:hypothetical protein
VAGAGIGLLGVLGDWQGADAVDVDTIAAWPRPEARVDDAAKLAVEVDFTIADHRGVGLAGLGELAGHIPNTSPDMAAQRLSPPTTYFFRTLKRTTYKPCKPYGPRQVPMKRLL